MKLLFMVPILLGVSLAQTPTFTHNRFTENGKTFSQDGTNVIELCMSVQPPALAPAELQTKYWQEVQLCAGYVEGVADLLSDGAICIPPEVEGKQLVDVFVRYASKHQTMMHGPASRVVADALKEVYSCPKR